MFLNVKSSSSSSDGQKVSHFSTKVILLLLAVAAIYWLWIGLTQRSIIHDEGISLLAVNGILDHGYPVLPSGYMYQRGYLPHYLLAGVITIAGVNDFTIMLPSFLAAIGSLWLVYLLARDIIGKEWIGVIAALFLLLLQIQTFYATSPRMYMPLQFFTLLSVYSGWRGFIKGEAKFQLITLLSLGAAILSHVEGKIVLIALSLSMTAIIGLNRQRLPRIANITNLVGLIILGIAIWITSFHNIGEPLPSITGFTGPSPGIFGLNTSPRLLGGHIKQLEEVVPFGLVVMTVPLFLALRGRSRELRDGYDGLIYLLVFFSLAALGLMIGSPRTFGRLFLFILPIYVLVISIGLIAILESLGMMNRKLLVERISTRWVAALLISGMLLVNGGFLLFERDPVYADFYFHKVKSAFDISCNIEGNNSRCSKKIKHHYDDLRKLVKRDDLIISSNPQVTQYYLGRVDGFLRLNFEKDGIRASEVFTIDEYIGIPIIDSESEVNEILSGNRRVWIITDYWTQIVQSGVAITHVEFIKNTLDVYRDDSPSISTYVHCFDSTCGGGVAVTLPDD